MKKNLLTFVLVLSNFVSVYGQQGSTTGKIEQDMDKIELNVIKDEIQTTVSPEDNFVRISRITVDPSQLESYKTYLKEGVEAAMQLEPGVLTLYAVSEKEHPNRFTILEIYADENAYRNHIQTPHFQKYKKGTLDMVQELQLIDSNPLIPGLKIK